MRTGKKKWLTKQANTARNNMIDQYGYEEGNHIFYAKAEKEFDGPRTVTMSQKANTVYARHAQKRNT